jgi:hypothetical protein
MQKWETYDCGRDLEGIAICAEMVGMSIKKGVTSAEVEKWVVTCRTGWLFAG